MSLAFWTCYITQSTIVHPTRSLSFFYPNPFCHSLWCLPDLKGTSPLTNCSCYSCNGLYTLCWIESLCTQSARSLTSASLASFLFSLKHHGFEFPPWRLCQTGAEAICEVSLQGCRAEVSVMCGECSRAPEKSAEWTETDEASHCPPAVRVRQLRELKCRLVWRFGSAGRLRGRNAGQYWGARCPNLQALNFTRLCDAINECELRVWYYLHTHPWVPPLLRYR